MFDLLLAAFQVVASGLSGRAAYLLSGFSFTAAGIWILCRAGGMNGYLAGGALLSAVGLGLFLVGIKLRVPRLAENRKASSPSSDNWKPPDAEEVRRIVRGS